MLLCRARGLAGIGDLRVDTAVCIVSHALEQAVLLKLERALVGPGERQKAQDVLRTLEVDHMGVVALHAAGVDPKAPHDFDQALGHGEVGRRKLKVEIPARVCHVATG